jgi:Ca-activated chloride channel family protein
MIRVDRAALTALLGLLLIAGALQAQPGLSLVVGGYTGVEPAPLLHSTVRIDVAGPLARVLVEQRFRNTQPGWVEGVYRFPLPADAAIDSLYIEYAGREIRGEIREREAAQGVYRAARDAGQGAALVEQQRANLFTVRVANIPPDETVRVRLGYRQEVAFADGVFALRFPTVVAPRYQPPGEGPRALAEAAAISPPVEVGEGPVPAFSLQVNLDSGLPLQALHSPSHRIEIEALAAGRQAVRLAAGATDADRDFVLEWRPQPAAVPAAALFAERHAGDEYGLLMLMPPPPAQVEKPPRELILVVDTSGSMHGDSIAQARTVLVEALDALGPADRFNLVEFNDRPRALFPRALPADADALRRARARVRSLQAEGGTEMVAAMRLALHDPAPSGLLRQVVFITDGAIGNEETLFATVSDRLGGSRLFMVGIGSAPNGLLMRRAARLGRGSFTFVGAGDAVRDKVGGLLRQLRTPALTDLSLAWEDERGPVAVDQAPDPVPDLYAGQPLTVALRAGRMPARVRIRGRFGGVAWERVVPLHAAVAGQGLHALWARRAIEDEMVRLALGADPAGVRAAVLALALRHGLVSRYTSLVAVDSTPKRPLDAPTTRAEVPVALPAGWSAQAVFGQLPATATPAALYLLSGLLTLAFAGLLAWRRRP